MIFRNRAARPDEVLQAIAEAHGASSRQVALAFLTRAPSVFAIPKASTPEHAADNAAAGKLVLGEDEIAALDKAFPRGPRPREPADALTGRGSHGVCPRHNRAYRLPVFGPCRIGAFVVS